MFAFAHLSELTINYTLSKQKIKLSIVDYCTQTESNL